MTNSLFFIVQLLPLLVFLIVDGIFSNTIYSIISAIVAAVLYMSYSFIKTGNIDYMILIDVALIVGLGVISIIVKNDLFFKMKPAIIDGVMIIFLIVLFFASENFLLSYFGRFTPNNLQFQPAMIPILKKAFIGLSIYTAFHLGAVWYTALHSSRKVWAFVAGPGYFLLFIPIIGWIIFKKVLEKRKLSAIIQEEI